MADIKDGLKDVKKLDRSTVADGKSIQSNTIQPIVDNIEYLADNLQGKLIAGEGINIDEETNTISSSVEDFYTLPTASASVLGGVKIGNNLIIDQDGVLSATDLDTTYSAGDNVSIENGVVSAVDTKYTAGDNISIDETNKISVVSGEFVSEINSSEETLLISEESDIEGQRVIDINVNKDLLHTRIFVDKVEDLKAIENPQEGDVIILNGYWVVGDAPPVTYVFTIPRDFDGEYDEDEMDWYFFNNYGGYKYAEGTALIRPYQEGVVGAWRMVMEEDFIDCRNFGIFPTSQSVAYANEEGEIIGYYAQRYRNHPYFETEEYQENHYIRYGDYDNRVYIHFSKRIGRFLQFCAYNSKEAYFPQLLSISNKNTPSYYCIDI